MRDLFISTKQIALVFMAYIVLILLTLLVFEGPIIYIFGFRAMLKSLGTILPTLLAVTGISLLLALIWTTLLCQIFLEKPLHHYRMVARGTECRPNNEVQTHCLKKTKWTKVNAVLLALTPLACYLLLIDYQDTISMKSLGTAKIEILLLNSLFGITLAMLYTDISQIIFEPVCRSFNISLQNNFKYFSLPSVRMSITSLVSCLVVLLFIQIILNLKMQVNSHIIFVISTNLYDESMSANIDYQIQSIYEEIAASYPIRMDFFWENIDFSSYYNNLLNVFSMNKSLLFGYKDHIPKILYVGLLFLLVFSVSLSNVFILCRQYKNRINGIFQHIRGLLRGERNFSSTIAIISLDETGYLISCLNLLTMTSGKISEDVQERGEKLQSSLARQSDHVNQLNSTVNRLLENKSVTNQSLKNEEEEHQIIKNNLHSVQNIILKVNEMLTNQIKYVDAIANQVNKFAYLVDNVKQITEKAERESRALAFSVANGEKVVQNSIVGMKEIADASEAIENIIGAITKLAAQTSLLSMNAAIEAAHAGEYGSGFAVLAQEVRGLSESATAQSRAIRQQIENLVVGIESGLGISEDTTGILAEISNSIEQNNVFVKNIIQAMTEQHQSSHDIVNLIEASVRRSSRIRSLTDRQISKGQEIMNSMINFLAISESIANLSNISSTSIKNISQYVQGIEAAIAKNKGVSEKIIEDAVAMRRGQSVK